MFKNEFERTLEMLYAKYKTHRLTKVQVAQILNISVATLDRRRSSLNSPKFVKLGSAKNASIFFPIDEVAKYVSNEIAISKKDKHGQC